MVLSTLNEQRDLIIEAIRNTTRGDWMVLIVDETSKKVIDNVVKQDDILNYNIAQIERIEDRREMNPEMDAIYILSPQDHVVECLLADLDRRRYRRAFLIWTAVLDPELRRRLQGNPMIAASETIPMDFFPRESHLITFRDPWSFPILYNPDCNNMVAKHLMVLAQKITGICVLLGENPKVRYYRPRNPIHEASVLCSHLARMVQEELDTYANYNRNWPPQSSRPQGVLLITDRSMDLMAPLIHEFTYQAMAHDLLPIKESDKVTYHMTINEGTLQAEEKDMELTEKDKVWVENRHRHMKDTIDKLMGDFQKFIDENPHFTNENSDPTSLNAIRDMLAGLPQFQEMKEAYSLHLTMAQESMNIFQHNKLPEIASVEQTLATGLDENFRKPKNILEEIVPLLDDEAIKPSDRLRLIMMWILYRDGVIPEDINRLLAHAQLPPQDREKVLNLEHLGGRVWHGLKDARPAPMPLFPKSTKNATVNEEYALSRYEPVLQSALEELCKGTLDQTIFPYQRGPSDPNEDLLAAQQGSLRAGRPNWASSGRRAAQQNMQRILVFVAGGATYSESRVCYEVGARQSRDIILASSHLLSPQLFLRQVQDLSVDRRKLDLPMDRPKPRAPAHLYEQPKPQGMQMQQPPPQGQQPGRTQMGSGMPSRPGPGPSPAPSSGSGRNPMPTGGLPNRPGPRPAASSVASTMTSQMSSMTLDSRPSNTSSEATTASDDVRKPHKLEKKKRNLFGMKK